MYIYPIYSDLDHLELLSWDRTGITNARQMLVWSNLGSSLLMKSPLYLPF